MDTFEKQTRMGKPEQFLWIVQTMTIRNAINLASNPDRSERYREEISATGAFMVCQDAIYASERIPEGKSASEAAHEFCFYYFRNLHNAGDKEDADLNCPEWFSR